MILFKKNILLSFLFLFLFIAKSVFAEIVFSHEDDSISYDDANNHYIIRYVGQEGELNEVNWQPPTNINVEVESDFEVSKNGTIVYEYEFTVDKTSKLALSSFHLYALNVDKTSIKSPESWRVLVRDSYESTDPTQRVSWYTTTKRVQAGDEVEDFELESMALPVYDTLFVRGKTATLRFTDYGPKVETHNYLQDEVIAKHVKGKGVNTAIPLIPVSETFNAVETYTAFHQSLLDYIEKGYIDSIISTSLTESSAAVLTALTLNDVNSALSKLKAVKKLVEGEDENHKNEKGNGDSDKGKPQPLILKELRKILKFNLKFIKKELKGDSKED